MAATPGAGFVPKVGVRVEVIGKGLIGMAIKKVKFKL